MLVVLQSMNTLGGIASDSASIQAATTLYQRQTESHTGTIFKDVTGLEHLIKKITITRTAHLTRLSAVDAKLRKGMEAMNTRELKYNHQGTAVPHQ